MKSTIQLSKNMISFSLKHFVPALLLIVVACTEEIELDPGTFYPNIVVDATITNENNNHLVKLYKTREFGETEVPMVTGAEVSVSFDDSTIRFIEPDTLPGYYYSEIPFAGQPGVQYHLRITGYDVDKNGVIDTCEAFATMPNTLVIDSVGYDYNVDYEFLALTCYAWDPGEKNYYNFKAWKNDTLVTDTLYEYIPQEDEQFNGNYTNGITCQYFQDEVDDEYIVNGDKLTLEIQNIDKAFYDYITSAQKEYFGYNPMFGGLPANVYSNTSNNAIGIFRVYTVNKASVVVKDFREKPQEK